MNGECNHLLAAGEGQSPNTHPILTAAASLYTAAGTSAPQQVDQSHLAPGLARRAGGTMPGAPLPGRQSSA